MSRREVYFGEMSTFANLPSTSVLSLVARLVVGTVALTLVLLVFVPWQQTAYGSGFVRAVNPNERIQSISALVPGQVETWHVREGQSVSAGDPIVTLVDSDPALVERLNNQIVAFETQKKAQEDALITEEGNLVRQRRLLQQGLASQRDLERATVEIQKLKAEIAKTDGGLNRLRVERARQSLQTKTAPRDGIVTNLLASGGATYVNAGEVIASFIPLNISRSAVINVSGLDAPLISKGRKVTLQFEGLPAVLFSGWPDHSHGTFNGIVDFVEPVADTSGRFKVWIKPDPKSPSWPSEEIIRLGSRVQGWVILEEVRLGFELWRQLNNFPPLQSSSQGTVAR